MSIRQCLYLRETGNRSFGMGASIFGPKVMPLAHGWMGAVVGLPRRIEVDGSLHPPPREEQDGKRFTTFG